MGQPEWKELMRFPTREEDAAYDKRLLARAGLKTLKALYTGAGDVSVTWQGDEIEIAPARYAGNSYWEGLPADKTIVVPDDVDNETLGANVLEALDICRSA